MPIMIETDTTMDQAGNIVAWSPKYFTGIKLVDLQHKELISLTNELYHACLSGDEAAKAVFKETMSRMVEYVRFHFDAEQKMLQKINYPQYFEHKKKHEELVRSILDSIKEYDEGRKFVPNHFVRTLKDWIFGHIGIDDMLYASYIMEQKKKGLITNAEIETYSC